MGQFEVRVAREEDWLGIADGFARSAGREPGRIRAHVLHGLRDNPEGSSGVVARDPSGCVIAHLGVTHVPMVVKGEAVLFGRFHSCFVALPYRTGGAHSLFTTLDDVFRAEFETEAHLAAVFGQWDEVDWWCLRRARGHDAIATSIDLRWAVDQRLRELQGDGVVVTRGLDTPDATSVLELGDCGVRHDRALDSWRARSPGRNDILWQVSRRDQRTGMAITRDAAGVRTILDWAVAPGDRDSSHALLHAILKDSTTPVHTRFWTSDWLTVSQFQEVGFTVEAGPEVYLSVRTVLPHIHHLWLSEAWHVTLADAGLRAMPRMTIGDPATRGGPTSGKAL